MILKPKRTVYIRRRPPRSALTAADEAARRRRQALDAGLVAALIARGRNGRRKEPQ
jgi:hypothetical protein